MESRVTGLALRAVIGAKDAEDRGADGGAWRRSWPGRAASAEAPASRERDAGWSGAVAELERRLVRGMDSTESGTPSSRECGSWAKEAQAAGSSPSGERSTAPRRADQPVKGKGLKRDPIRMSGRPGPPGGMQVSARRDGRQRMRRSRGWAKVIDAEIIEGDEWR